MEGGTLTRVQDVYDWLNELAPFDTAASFDNVGLLVGDPAAEATGVLFAVDATDGALREAARVGANLLVAHHPLMFAGVKRVRLDEPEGRVIAGLIGAGASLIAAHTNLDQASGGTGDSLAHTLGLADVYAANAYLRVGALPEPLTAEGLRARIAERLQTAVRVYCDTGRPISRVAVGPGALGEDAALAAAEGAQAYVVGEIHHHEILDACARGMTVFDAGHYATEYPGVKALRERFASERPEIPAFLMRL